MQMSKIVIASLSLIILVETILLTTTTNEPNKDALTRASVVMRLVGETKLYRDKTMADLNEGKTVSSGKSEFALASGSADVYPDGHFIVSYEDKDVGSVKMVFLPEKIAGKYTGWQMVCSAERRTATCSSINHL